jgi:hypothetical protein
LRYCAKTNPDVDGLLTVLTGEVGAFKPDKHEREVHRIPLAKMQDVDAYSEDGRLEA